MKREMKMKVAGTVLLAIFQFSSLSVAADAPTAKDHSEKPAPATADAASRPAGELEYKLPESYDKLRSLYKGDAGFELKTPKDFAGQFEVNTRKVGASESERKNLVEALAKVEATRKKLAACEKSDASSLAFREFVDSYVKYLHDASAKDGQVSFEAAKVLSFERLIAFYMDQRRKEFFAEKGQELSATEKEFVEAAKSLAKAYVPDYWKHVQDTNIEITVAEPRHQGGESVVAAPLLDQSVLTEFNDKKIVNELKKFAAGGEEKFCKVDGSSVAATPPSAPVVPEKPSSAVSNSSTATPPTGGNSNENDDTENGSEEEETPGSGTPAGGTDQATADRINAIEAALNGIAANAATNANSQAAQDAARQQALNDEAFRRGLFDDDNEIPLEQALRLRPNEAPSGNTGGSRTEVPPQQPNIAPQLSIPPRPQQPLDPNAGLQNNPQGPMPFNPMAMLPQQQNSPQAPFILPQLGQNLDDRRDNRPATAAVDVQSEVAKALAPMWQQMNSMLGGYPQMAYNGMQRVGSGLTRLAVNGFNRLPGRLTGAIRRLAKGSNGPKNLGSKSGTVPARLQLGR